MNGPSNIIAFKPGVDLPLEFDEETLQGIDEIARADGKTRDDIIREAVDQFVADCNIGEQLINHLWSLRKSYPAKHQRWDPIKIWHERILKIQQQLGTEPSGTPTPGKAA